MYTAQRLVLTLHHATAQHTTAHHSTAHHSTPQHSTPQHTIAHHTTPHHTTPQHTIAHHTTPQHTTAHHSTPHHTTPHHTTPHHTLHSGTALHWSTQPFPSQCSRPLLFPLQQPACMAFPFSSSCAWGAGEIIVGRKDTAVSQFHGPVLLRLHSHAQGSKVAHDQVGRCELEQK